MPRTKILVENNFAQYSRELADGVGRGLTAGGRHVAASCRSQSTGGYQAGAVLASVSSDSARRSRKGWRCEVTCHHELGLIFELGTYRRLGASRGAKRGGGDRGVKPLRFMRRGLKAGFPGAVELVFRALP